MRASIYRLQADRPSGATVRVNPGFGLEAWVVVGEPLPPPCKGTHAGSLGLRLPRSTFDDWASEDKAYEWSRS